MLRLIKVQKANYYQIKIYYCFVGAKGPTNTDITAWAKIEALLGQKVCKNLDTVCYKVNLNDYPSFFEHYTSCQPQLLEIVHNKLGIK